MSWEVSADEWEAFQALETGSPLREWLGDAVYYSGRPRSRAMLIACGAGNSSLESKISRIDLLVIFFIALLGKEDGEKRPIIFEADQDMFFRPSHVENINIAFSDIREIDSNPPYPSKGC